MTGLRRVGDRAVLIECDSNRDAQGYASVLRQDPPPGAEDVVPAAKTVLVIFDSPAPARQHLAAVHARLKTVPGTRETHAAAVIALPVCYDGPDLDAVAELTGMTTEEVIRRHSARRYTVAFIGFMPGFAYLTGVDPALVVPRRAEPRTRVPAGSVAIAGEMAAVYPRASPGGWQLLGTTDARLFDAARNPPSLLANGAHVRFLPQ